MAHGDRAAFYFQHKKKKALRIGISERLFYGKYYQFSFIFRLSTFVIMEEQNSCKRLTEAERIATAFVYALVQQNIFMTSVQIRHKCTDAY